MPKRMLIDATHPEETRVVVADGNELLEYDYETSTKRQIKSNIYLAKVTRVEPSLQAAFVDFGGDRHGFLAFNEIHPDYYRIPIEDREKLLAESDAESEEEESAENGEAEGESVEVLGDSHDEDIQELSDAHRRRLRKLTRSYKIQEVIKRRQILLVQVVKEERGNKGAALTTYLSLPGRYCVLMPNTARGGGISRKVTDAKARKSMKAILSDLEVPEGMAVIMRTAGVARTKAEIKRDYEYLRRLWDDIRELTLDSTAPALIYEEGDVIKRALRDLYDRDIDEVLVEGDEAYKAAKALMRTMIPSHAKRVQKYEDTEIPLLSRYQIDQQLDAIHEPIVQLKSGGYIVINPTEALVAIDVNSGRSTRERNVEQTAYRTNLEAADEVARQLRLRDLAGLIVIDFIDMDVSRNNHAVERRMKDAMKSDRARIQIGRISAFGLLELSRQRLRPSLLEAHAQMCPVCNGSGFMRSTESISMSILRELEEEGGRKRAKEVTVKTQTDIALYLLNQKRTSLQDLEERYGFRVLVMADSALAATEYEITHIRHDGVEGVSSKDETVREENAPKRRRSRGRRRGSEDADNSEDEEKTEGDEKTADSSAEEREQSDDEDDEGRKRNGRRRGRRGGRRRRKADSDGETEQETTTDAEESSDSDSEAGTNEEQTDEDGEDSTRRRRRRPRRRGRRGRGASEEASTDENATDDDAVATDDDADAAPATDAESGDADADTDDAALDTEIDIPEPSSDNDAASEEDEPATSSDSSDGSDDGPDEEPEAVTVSSEDSGDDADEAEAETAEAPAEEPAEEPEEAPEPPVEDNRPRRSGWWSRGTS
ncbi:MAG: Rne/Rng family ribonuclease [Rhodospirillaceae bacterium]|jgi:ribonuclease E|nr:Rne/Rng family ribonuclease [Rhodospirillaceae bacterium]MBT3809130.1 Rne/Rng family ribonuclease [Rhodospirillaceae bacterium]MBT3932563.1 Rne/Rng family ribonuclease [Rhodospirillaceae bacterium]MBT4771901.1 Rne/Rng family ribonuclease [Rhodospirillaceae bacterium]MBT5358470.1 Rne/Rng family ribonuclease [Rhodospirillaceae bacterium]